MKNKAGQSLVETCIVMVFLCLIFFGLLQISQLTAAKDILDYAASCGTRARTVGFNPFMVHKVVRVAAIPNAGRLLYPEVARTPLAPALQAMRPGDAWTASLRAQPASPQLPIEASRIPLFLGAQSYGRLPAILDYEHWDSIRHGILDLGAASVRLHTSQEIPLWVPMQRLISGNGVIVLDGDATLENHYPLYLGYGTP